MTNPTKYIAHSSSRRNMVISLVVVVIVVIAGIWLVRGGASGFFASSTVSSSTLTGNAKVVDDTSAYSGKAVVFTAPIVTPPPSGGGGTATCPLFPAFPDEKCTGWKHTDVTTLKNCDDRTDNGYIWDDNPNKVFIGCYFSKGLTIQAPGVEIYKSQIHGPVNPHWSSNYSLRGLLLEDVEIESCLDYNDCSKVDDRKNPDGTPVFDYTNAAISGHDFTCRRCNIHNTVTGAHPGNNALIVDSFLHDFQIETDTNDQNAPLKSHGAAIGEGQNNGYGSKIIHNNLQCNRLPGQYQ
ncbi:MAG TPA: hypothetical protein VFB59_04155 [Candidatus Saccharimonadales bacterium]|nr:hypothetical protein [Candidatus Saccharimonadales bacterium]